VFRTSRAFVPLFGLVYCLGCSEQPADRDPNADSSTNDAIIESSVGSNASDSVQERDINAQSDVAGEDANDKPELGMEARVETAAGLLNPK
jgi:hypothetical protein